MSDRLDDGLLDALLLPPGDAHVPADALQHAQSRLQRGLGLLKRQICSTNTHQEFTIPRQVGLCDMTIYIGWMK